MGIPRLQTRDARVACNQIRPLHRWRFADPALAAEFAAVLRERLVSNYAPSGISKQNPAPLCPRSTMARNSISNRVAENKADSENGDRNRKVHSKRVTPKICGTRCDNTAQSGLS